MDLLTTRQVADRLHLDVSTIFRWAQLGKITPAYRLPGNNQMLFDPADVDRLEEDWNRQRAAEDAWSARGRRATTNDLDDDDAAAS